MKTIEDTWLRLRAGLIENYPEDMIDDLLKKVYYSGVIGTHFMIGRAASKEDSALLKALTTEIDQYQREMANPDVH